MYREERAVAVTGCGRSGVGKIAFMYSKKPDRHYDYQPLPYTLRCACGPGARLTAGDRQAYRSFDMPARVVVTAWRARTPELTILLSHLQNPDAGPGRWRIRETFTVNPSTGHKSVFRARITLRLP